MSNDKMSLREACDLLNIRYDAGRRKTYIPCPVCQSRNELRRNEFKMFLNFDKDMYRCAKCGDKASLTEGGPVSFWMLMKGIQDPKEAAKDYFKQRDGLPAEKRRKYEAPAPRPETPPAPIEVCDYTLRCLFKISNLRKKHRKALKEVRKLTDKEIDFLGYKSTPLDGKSAAAQLLAMGCTLKGVPPFYQHEDGTWDMKLYKRDGVMMPKLTANGKYRAVELCMNPGKDASYDGAKYLPFSSADLKSGTESRVYCHFRHGARGLRRIILTEGVMKADIISVLSGYSVLSISGVNSQQYLPAALKALSDVDVFEGIYIAFDNDVKEKEQVQKALAKLTALLDGLGIKYKDISGSWPKEHKGLDDHLIAQR